MLYDLVTSTTVAKSSDNFPHRTCKDQALGAVPDLTDMVLFELNWLLQLRVKPKPHMHYYNHHEFTSTNIEICRCVAVGLDAVGQYNSPIEPYKLHDAQPVRN